MTRRWRRLVFLRHGQTAWNAEERVTGQADVPLNRTGVRQALHARRVLAELPITSLWSSPLRRCRQTARLSIGAPCKVPFHVLPALAERDWGPFEGQPLATRPRFEADVSGAERLATFEARICGALDQIDDDGLPLIVAHSGAFRILRRQLGLTGVDGPIGNALPVRVSVETRSVEVLEAPGPRD